MSGAVDSESSSDSSSEGGGRALEEESWFHGHLSREELDKMLKTEGDFAVRYSLEQKPQLVLSVMGKAGKILSYIIHQSRSKTFFIQKKEFESIGDMVVFHMMTRSPVVEGSGALLKKGVGARSWELPVAALETKTKLGEGEFGTVWRAVWKTKAKETNVAVKELKKDKDWRMKQELLQEARLQLSLNHQHIVRCLGLAVKKEPLRMVLELVEGGSLLDWLRKGPPIGNSVLMGLLRELLSALAYLEQKGVVHRDVAARNCLLSVTQAGGTPQLKLSDFGLAIQRSVASSGSVMMAPPASLMAKAPDTRRIPIKWTAPEALATQDFSAKSDVWSFGVVVGEVWSRGKEPWPGLKTEEVRKELAAGRRPPVPQPAPPAALAALLASTHQHDPAQRPSSSRLLATFPTSLA